MKPYNPRVELLEVVVTIEKHGDEICFGMFWSCQAIVDIENENNCHASTQVLFGRVPLVFTTILRSIYHLMQCVCHLLRQHLTNTWRLSLSPSSPHLPQGYQDQRMVTCPHPLLDLSCQGIVLLVPSLTSDDRWLPAQYFSDTQELDPLKLDMRGRQAAKKSQHLVKPCPKVPFFSCSLLKTSVDSSVSLVAFNFYCCQQICRKLKLSCKKKACTYLNIYIYK